MTSCFRCSRTYQRLALRCILALVLVFAVLAFSNWPPAVNAEHNDNSRLVRKELKDENLADNTAVTLHDSHQESVLVETSHTAPLAHSATHLTEDFDQAWDEASRKINTLLEDELQVTALLAPLTKTGEPLLRDLSHRVRAFKDIYHKYESLHLVQGKEGLHQLPVIPRLRGLKRSSQSLAQAIGSYDRLRHFVNSFAKLLFPWTMLAHPDHMSLHASISSGGRGLVFTAGNDQARLLLTVIPSIRQLGCELPIEILYLGEEDLGDEMRDKLERIPDVVTRDLALMIDDQGWQLKGWAAKAFAILMSSFHEAIFIDADSLFFVDPATLFEDEAYRSTGALFFKDRNLSPENKRAWIKSILPSPFSDNIKKNRMWTGESGHMQESGVIVVDKSRHFIPLLLSTRLNGPDRDGDEEKGKKGVYEMMYGDKETFWLSWEMAGDVDYAFHSGGAGVMGRLASDPSIESEDDNSTTGGMMSTEKKPTVCSPQLIHLDRAGKPLWFNGWMSKTKDDLIDWQQFDVFLREPDETGKGSKNNPWSINPGNVVCLESEDTHTFTAKESAILDGFLDLAKKNSPMFEWS